MVAVIGQLLPLMLAVALSSVPIMVTVTILLGPRSTPRALTFLIGWLLGLVLVTWVFTLGFQAIPGASSRRGQSAASGGQLVVGSALLAYAVILLVRQRHRAAPTELPGWLRSVGTIRPVTALGLALLLNVRPKALLLATAAALIIGPSRVSFTETLAVVVIYAAIGGSTVSVPIILFLARPHAMRRPLEATSEWLSRNSRIVTVLVLLFAGVVVLGNGLAHR